MAINLSSQCGGENESVLMGDQVTPAKQVFIHQLFEQRARETPSATAVVCGNDSITYAEANASANQLARVLQERGVGKDLLVGICMHRCTNSVIAILAVLKAGGAYVPLDPTYPRLRLAAMLEDVNMEVVLTTSDVACLLAEQAKGKLLSLDTQWPEIATRGTENPNVPVTGDNLAYVIFTSGSTGRAKAAAVHHRGWANLMAWFTSEFSVTAEDKVLIISSASFDITQRSTAMPLIMGGQLHLLASPIFDPELATSTIERENIRIINCAPSMLYQLLEHANSSKLSRLNSLRTVFLGGEAISATRLKAWATARRDKAEVVNVYGVAECTDVSTYHRLRDMERYVDAGVPIGTPIWNTEVYVMDENQQILPRGEVGEICIGGTGIGRGYVNDGALTRAKFITKKMDGTTAILYRTGDLGRISSDGMLEYAGRVDHQVKLRGMRIELGEIESALRLHGGVKEAVVLSQEFSRNDTRLIAYIEPKPASEKWVAIESELRSFLKSRIPEYMVPNAIIALNEMPLTPNGKTDRKALSAMRVDSGRVRCRTRGEREITAPGTATETQVVRVFEDVLRIDAVDVHDNFFDIGGHSYLLTEAISQLVAVYGVDLSIFDFLSGPTAAQLAAKIDLKVCSTQTVAS